MKRYAIYGAGSLGTVLGAYITKNGGEIDLINRNKAHIAALKENGAHITGTVDFIQPVSALLPEEMEGEYDLIILMTKQLNNKETLEFLLPHLAADQAKKSLGEAIPADYTGTISTGSVALTGLGAKAPRVAAVESLFLIMVAKIRNELSVLVLFIRKLLPIPVICDLICAAGNGMAHYLIAEALCTRNELSESIVSAVALIARILLGEASVVSAGTPADKADLRLVNTVALQGVNDLIKSFNSCRNVHLGLVFECLTSHGGGNRLPAHTDAELKAIRRTFERLALLYSLCKRNTARILYAGSTVEARHIRISCAGHSVIGYYHILIGGISVKTEVGRDGVNAVLHLNVEASVKILLFDMHKYGILIFGQLCNRT